MHFDLHSMLQAITYVSFHLTKALTAVVQPGSFLYWPFLASAATIAVLVAVIAHQRDTSGGKLSTGKAAAASLSGSAWWSASARADYRLYFANALILPALFGVLLFTDAHVVNLMNALLGKPAVSSGPSAEASILSRIVFTVIFFAAYDFGRFVAHSLLHDLPVLWEFHKVHHSAETMNPITTFRAHPLDLLIMAWVPAFATGLATWVFNQFTAAPISFYSFLGLHVLIFAFNLVGILRHSHVWLHYGPRWGKWFISPAHHQLHHSCEARHIGVNRGFELAIWDRLYGTLYVPGKKEPFRMGLGDGTDEKWHSVGRMYVWPFVNAAKRVRDYTRRRSLQIPPSQPLG